SAGEALGVEGTHTSWKINDPGVVGFTAGGRVRAAETVVSDCPSVNPETSGVARMAFCSSVECAFPAVGSTKVVCSAVCAELPVPEMSLTLPAPLCPRYELLPFESL